MLDPKLVLGVNGEMVRMRFFDVRTTNTNSASQHHVKTEKVLLLLVFSVSEVLGEECSKFHKHMVEN